MKVLDVKAEIGSSFAEKMEHYVYKKTQCKFVRRCEEFTLEYTILCIGKGGWVLVAPKLGFSIPFVVDLYNSVSGESLPKSNAVYDFHIYNRFKKRGYHAIETITELEQLSVTLHSEFVELVNPILNECADVKSLALFIQKRAEEHGWKFTGSQPRSLCLLMITAWSVSLDYEVYVKIAVGCYEKSEEQMAKIQKVKSFLDDHEIVNSKTQAK